MANTDIALKEAMTIDGTLGTALVDLASGMSLGVMGGTPDMDPAVAAGGHTGLVRAKQRTMEMLGVGGAIEDILITLTWQYHLTARSPRRRAPACSWSSTGSAPTWPWPAADCS